MDEAGDGRRSRVWVVGVAAVAALLLSGTVAVLNAGNSRFRPIANPTVTVLRPESPTVQKNLDLCGQTAKRLVGTVAYPERSTWRAVLGTETSGRSSVTVIRANGEPLFCEITTSGVTLSNPAGMPAYAAGSRTGVLLSTFAGTVAGVVDPSWDQVHIAADIPYANRIAGNATVADGLFVYSTSTSLVDDRVRVGPTDNPSLELPKPPRQYGSSSPELSSGSHGYGQPGQRLTNCIDSTTTAVPDAESWNSGAVLSSGNTNLILATNAAGVSTCLLHAGHAEFRPYLTMQAYTQVPLTLPMPTVDGRTVIGGLVPPGVRRMTLTFADKTTTSPNVDENTFAVFLPPGVSPSPKDITCELVGYSEQVLYNGPLT